MAHNARAAASRLLPCGRLLRVGRRAFVTSASGSKEASTAANLLTLRELDRLVTSIANSSTGTPSHATPLAMRNFPSPWLSSKNPDLGSQRDTHDLPRLSEEEVEELHRPKHMSESYTTFDLPLASDRALLERYINTSGGFRMGKLLEHLDSLAGAVAYRHCLPSPTLHAPETSASFHEASERAGLYLATASADRLDMFGRLNRDNVRDLRFSGFVTWTGNSSMEVVVKLQGSRMTRFGDAHEGGDGDGGWQTLMLGRFAMVCRDAITHKARAVPRLIVETEEEKALWELGEDHRRRQKESSMMALDKVPPSSEEAKELHDLMLQVADSRVNEIEGEMIVPMRDTELESVQLMFPQDRNLHGKVFGGILMRLAFELCFTNAAVFASKPLRFLALDGITFRLPVPIGAVLRLSSKVVKTTKPTDGEGGEAKVHVVVRAEVEEVETGLRRETNTFFFTMAKEDHEPLGRTVVPYTYAEAMSYLEGKRRLELGDEMRRLGMYGREPVMSPRSVYTNVGIVSWAVQVRQVGQMSAPDWA